MATENDKSTFSVRLPTALVKMLDQRAALNRRSRNGEVEILLEQAIDLHVMRDKKLLEEHAARTTET